MTPELWALVVGLLTAAVLIAEHYLLDHRTAWFRAHPPRAYTVGVGTLFAGYALWTLLNPGPYPTLTIFLCWALITALGGGGTWTAWRWHDHQEAYRADATTRQRERR